MKKNILQLTHTQPHSSKPEKRILSNNILQFPIPAHKDKKPEKAVGKSRKPLTGFSVCIVDDEFINQYMLSAHFLRMGAQVSIHANGQELLDALETEQPDIILMDIRMPVMDGLEATRRIRAAELLRGAKEEIPIIAFTAHGTPGFEKICLSAGMNGYLPKAIDISRLLDVVMSCCSKQQIGLSG